MFQHILLAADGSVASSRAESIAFELAVEQKALLRIVHVVDIHADFFVTPESIGFLMSAGQKVLDDILSRAGNAGIDADKKLLQSDIGGHHTSALIIDEACTWPADLIVIGSHGRRGLGHFLLGSVAEGVCQGAKTPVLLAR